MATTLGELADRFDCELRGERDTIVDRVGTLADAGASALTFISNAAYKPQLSTTRAAAVILRPSDADDCPVAALLHEDPYACYARMAAEVVPPPAVKPGIHATASVAGTATVANSASVGPNAVIEGDAVIGEHCHIGAGSYVGPASVLGDHTALRPNVTIVRAVRCGERCLFHSGAVIGGDGFGNAMTREGWVKVPQLGGVVIGSDVEVGCNTTIDCGAVDDTVIGSGVRIDNLCMIAHNVHVGDHTAMAAGTGIAGSARIGKRCMFAGQSGTVGHITVCDDVVVTGKTMVTKDIRSPGAYSGAFPAEASRDWAKNVGRIRRLGALSKRVSRLEKDKS